MHKQRMRTTSAGARLEWKTIAVTAADPLAFAQELQTSLQELTNGGYTINSQMPRGDALVLTASRIVTEPHEPVPETQPPRRRLVALPSERVQSDTTEEVLYHYIESGEQKQRCFPSLIDALRVVNQHLREAPDVLPVNITICAVSRFEAEAFPMLLKMFADDLPCPPG